MYIAEMKTDILLCASSCSVVSSQYFRLGQGHLEGICACR